MRCVAAPLREVILQVSYSRQCRSFASCMLDGRSASKVFSRQSSVGNLQSAVFSRQSSVGSLQSAVFNRQSSIGSLQSAVFNRQSSVGSLQSAVFNRQSSVGSRNVSYGKLIRCVAAPLREIYLRKQHTNSVITKE